MPTTVKLTRDGGVATLKLSSSEGLHILGRPVLEELVEYVDALSTDPNVSCLVLTGEGERTFSAGADLRALVEMTTTSARAYAEFGQKVTQSFARFPVPTICALNGPVYGGGIELAITCDIRVATQGTVFLYQAAKLGLLPGWGGTQRLPALVGPSRAKAMMLLCRPVGAPEALEWGLVDEVVPRSELREAVKRWAASATELARHSAVQIKRALDLGNPGDYAGEREAFAACFATGETQARIQEFLSRSGDKHLTPALPDIV